MRLIPALSEGEKLAFIHSVRSLKTAVKGKPVRFRHQGRTLRGIDCIGLIVLGFRGIGIHLADRTDYGRLPAQRKLDDSLQEHFGPPVTGPLQPADILSMSWGAESGHVAVVSDHPDGLGIIHCYRNAACVIEHRLAEHHLSLITAAYRT